MLCRIGNIEVWRILESVDPFLMPEDFFVDTDLDPVAELARLAPRQLCPETGRMLLPIQGFLLKTPDHVILVDACVGNHKTFPLFDTWHQRSGGRFMAGLAAAGVSPEDVDYVLCTHLHVDHVGWNTKLEDGRWVPTFANARYILPAEDNAHFCADPSPVYQESVSPVIAAGQAELVAADHQLGDHVALISTPGHTPGHVSVQIRDGDMAAIITGDALHSTVQCWHPHWNFAHDADRPLAAQSRRTLLEISSGSGDVILGSHFPLPSLGRIRADGDNFRWIED